MKKRTKISLVLSSAAAILLAGSIMAGGTYALFTSESKTNIAVNSGKVDVSATIDGLKTYSGEANSLTGDPTADAAHIVETTAQGTFTNGGTAKINTTTGDLELFNVTPGDKVTFNIKVKNNSTVAVKYRTLIKEESDGGLFRGLTFKIDGSSTVSRTKWAELTKDDEKVLPCEVSLPSDAGNKYQNKKATISFTVEAVQGNAQTYVYPEGVTKDSFAQATDIVYTDTSGQLGKIDSKWEELKARMAFTKADDATIYYASDLNAAILSGATKIYVSEDAVFTHLFQHICVKNDLVLYANDANFIGTDLSTNGVTYDDQKIDADVSLTINDAINLRYWGYSPKEDHTINVTLNNCLYVGESRTTDNKGLLYVTGTTGTLNATINNSFCSDVGEGMKTECNGTVTVNNSTFNRCGVGIKAAHKANGNLTMNVKDTTFNSCGCLKEEDQTNWLYEDSSAIKCKTKGSIALNLTNIAVNNKIGDYAFHIDDDDHTTNYTGETTVSATNVTVDGETYTFNNQ